MDDECTGRLSAATFDDEVFEALDLSGADLSHKEFNRCTFRGTKLRQTSWSRARLEDCVFEGCDLSSFRPQGAALGGVEFKDCKLLGVEWSDLGASSSFGFSNCAMGYQTFVSLHLRNALFARCALVESTFADVDLAKATFRDCDLRQTVFDRCDLSGTDFATSRSVYFDTAKNRAKGARIPIETAALMASAAGLVIPGFFKKYEE